MAEERFRFREDVLRTAAGKTRRRLGLTLLAAASGVVAFWAVALREQGSGAGTLVLSLAFLLALAALSMRRRMRRLHARWGSFEVTIGQDAVERVVTGAPPVRIARTVVLAVAASWSRSWRVMWGDHSSGLLQPALSAPAATRASWTRECSASCDRFRTTGTCRLSPECPVREKTPKPCARRTKGASSAAAPRTAASASGRGTPPKATTVTCGSDRSGTTTPMAPAASAVSATTAST
jgi:hypothetical protein